MRDKRRLKALLAHQCAQTANLRKELALWKKGHEELCRASDAICLAAALKFGGELDGGGREMTLPRIDINELTRNYELDCSRSADGYIVRARPVRAEIRD